MSTAEASVSNDDADENGEGTPPAGRSRLRLDTLDRVRRELVKIYRQGREGERDVSDASKLAHILTMIARILEGSDLEKRIAALEAAARQER
jgi:uncharacterized Zn finger protein (UPF0148 family)